MNFDLVGYAQENIGIALYVLAFVSLLYYVLRGKKVNVPGPFFLLTGLGGLFMTYDLIKSNRSMQLIVSRAFMTLVAFYVYFV